MLFLFFFNLRWDIFLVGGHIRKKKFDMLIYFERLWLKMSLTLKRVSCLEGWWMIKERLSGSGVSEIFKRGLDLLKEAGSEYNVYLGELDVSEISSDVLKQVIGKEGCYFIKTTEECDLDFVWHNRNTKKIEFWGQERPW